MYKVTHISKGAELFTAPSNGVAHYMNNYFDIERVFVLIEITRCSDKIKSKINELPIYPIR